MASENEIEHAVLTWLNTNGYFAWKVPTTGYFDGKRWRKQASPFAINGQSDILSIKEGKTIYLEIKTLKNRQNKAQKAFEEKIKQFGGIYYVVHSVAEMKAIDAELFN